MSTLHAGPRAALGRQFFAQPAADGLVSAVRQIATSRGVTAAQVCLNWCRAKGAVPISGARTLEQAADSLSALQWKLEPDEVRRLDAASAAIVPLAEKPLWPTSDINTGLKLFDS